MMSTGNVLPSARRPARSRPVPIGRMRISEESVFGAMADVTFSEVLRQQCLDRNRDESCRLAPEQSTRRTIGVPYDTPLIYDEDRIG